MRTGQVKLYKISGGLMVLVPSSMKCYSYVAGVEAILHDFMCIRKNTIIIFSVVLFVDLFTNSNCIYP